MNIDLSDTLEARVRALAKSSGKGVSALIIDALEQLLEDEADKVEISARRARFEETGEAIAHDDVLAKLRSRAGD